MAISFNKRERLVAVVVFLDYEKAFDNVWHQGLLAKIFKLNLPHHLVNITKYSLEDRTFCIRQGEETRQHQANQYRRRIDQVEQLDEIPWGEARFETLLLPKREGYLL